MQGLSLQEGSGMDLKYWEECLSNRENELKRSIEDLSSEVSGKGSSDAPDMANNDIADDAWRLVDNESVFSEIIELKKELFEVKHALFKVREKKDRYGVCEKCNKSIDLERLRARPWARYCYNCQVRIDGNH
jgi:DnaK suppressor protein